MKPSGASEECGSWEPCSAPGTVGFAVKNLREHLPGLGSEGGWGDKETPSFKTPTLSPASHTCTQALTHLLMFTQPR